MEVEGVYRYGHAGISWENAVALKYLGTARREDTRADPVRFSCEYISRLDGIIQVPIASEADVKYHVLLKSVAVCCQLTKIS